MCRPLRGQARSYRDCGWSRDWCSLKIKTVGAGLPGLIERFHSNGFAASSSYATRSGVATVFGSKLFCTRNLRLSPTPSPITHQDLPEPRSISLREAFLFWLKLGFISFGGRFRSCIRNWSSAGAGSPSGAFCTPSTIACCCPGLRLSSWRPTSAG
ncbi:hypothetical protein EMIT0P291_150006 [Pseudomonas sp. IT-P291]